nr:hypothetical protein [Tanacetum cinerariifolium]
MMDYTHCGLQMINNYSMDRLVKDMLMMELVMHTEKNDTVFHMEKIGMLMLVVEIDVGCMTADVVDKLNCSSDDVQPRKVDLSHKLRGESSFSQVLEAQMDFNKVKRTQIMDEQLEHILHEALRMMDSTHGGLQMIENHSMDRLVKEVLMMELVTHTGKNDTVFHKEKTGMVILVVEIDVGGMTVDVVDKFTCSSDDVKPKQLDL